MKAPVFVAPAMDLDMYAHQSTQDNLEMLRQRGNHIIEPASGELASHLTGKGRMQEPEEIVATLEEFFYPKDMIDRRVLITSGPTYEKIDPVRFIGNYSSGKMGEALAMECARRGAEVLMVSGPVHHLPQHDNIDITKVESAAEMYDEATRLYPTCTDAILCAAVADFTPETTADEKIKREGDDMILRLNPTRDIAAELGRMKRSGQRLVGFALETNNEASNAREKLQRKNFDFIVLNSLRDENAGFMHDTNKITIISPTSEHQFELKTKSEVARDIVNELVKEV